MDYSRNFRNIKTDVVRLTRDLVKTKPWRKTNEEKQALAEAWVRQVSAIYDMPAPTVMLEAAPDHNGCYSAADNCIRLGNPFSIVTLLHEFRHAMQRHVDKARQLADVTDPEHDARGWSLSLFREAAPRRYRKMVVAGRIFFTAPPAPEIFDAVNEADIEDEASDPGPADVSALAPPPAPVVAVDYSRDDTVDGLNEAADAEYEAGRADSGEL